MTFHENWYSDAQCTKLAELARSAPQGAILEIGCWEGKSTIALANAVFPRTVHAVDHWEGNKEESADHPSVVIAQQRDVFATFVENVTNKTAGNVTSHKMAWQEFLTAYVETNFLPEYIAFLHVDASHDYQSVIQTLHAWHPFTVAGAIFCGDDFLTADASRTDLNGGVERAVREFAAEHNLTVQNDHNLWWVILP